MRTRARAEKQIQWCSESENSVGKPSADGELYDAVTPFDFRIAARTGSPLQNRSARGRAFSAIRRLSKPVLLVSSVSGYLYSHKDEGGEIEHSHATPETLLRIGLSDDIEFRIWWNYNSPTRLASAARCRQLTQTLAERQ